MFDWIRRLFSEATPPSKAPKPRRPSFRPQLEPLEDRIAPAATVVDTAADDGSAGSLREIIANAPANSTITFDPNVFPPNQVTIIWLDPERGSIPITTNNLTINGGTSDIRLNGQNETRIFSILGGNLTETIKNLQFQDGYGTLTDNEGQSGGAIDDNSNGSLTLIGDEFSDNVAVGSGGAVRADLGANNTLTVDGCAFNGNKTTTSTGGAIESDADGTGPRIVVTGSSFGENSAGSAGGAIFAAGSQLLQITNAEFVGNTSGGDGGAVAYISPPAVPSTLLLTYSTFTDNQAQNGGGLYIGAANADDTGTVTETINGCLFNGNQAIATNSQGGGLEVEQRLSFAGSATVNLFNSTFYNNTSDGYGGGISLLLGATDSSINNMLMNVTSLTVTKNQASTQGGGVYIQLPSSFAQANPAPTLTNNIIAGNTVGNPPNSGPDIFGSIITSSYNLVGIGDGATVTNNNGNWLPKDIVGSSTVPQDPGLDPNGLQNNGGLTQTIALVTMGADKSKAYQQGNDNLATPPKPTGTEIDQRGYRRPTMGAHVSIGAYDPEAIVVLQGQSSTSINSSLNPAQLGQPVTLTAEVTTDAGTPTGTVTFFDGTTTLGTTSLDDYGYASLTTSALTLGSHNITATYNGDDDSAGSSDSLTEVISQETSSSVYVTSSVNPALPGQIVTFTATVSGMSGTPTGNVTFMDGDTVLGTGTLDANGHATLTTATLSLGSQTITAIYGGDATYGSSDGSLTQTVNQGQTYTSLSSNANPAQPGQTVTFTSTVSSMNGGTPTGNVTFYDGSTVLGTGTLAVVNGQNQATFATTTLALGSHAISAVYEGDDRYAGSSGTTIQTVNLSTTSTSLSSTANPAQPGQTITFTATVSSMSGGTPTGNVTFYDGTTLLGTGTLAVVNGQTQATFATSTLALGSHDIIAVYGGDNRYADSSSSSTQAVNLAGTYTSLASTANPSQPGQTVTFTATVGSMNGGTPTGNVTFYDGTTLLGTGTLAVVNGQAKATFATSTLALGSHDITAVYGSDGVYASSSGTTIQAVNLSTTYTSLSSTANPSQPGNAVTFTATVSSMNGGTPTGNVTFYSGTTVLGSGSLAQVNGQAQATFTTGPLGTGNYVITAIYGGNGSYAGSSGMEIQRVGQPSGSSSSTYLMSSASPALPGQTLTLTATVSGMNGTPTGSVTFYDGTSVLGSETLALVNGQAQATFTTSALSLGSHGITAIYSGDGTYTGSASSWMQSVSLAGSNTYVMSSASPIQPGQSVTFTATVSSMSGGTPTGSVIFMDGNTVLGNGTLTVVNGQAQATFATSALGLGSHDITAIYGGDSTHAGSASSMAQTVSLAGSNTYVMSSASPTQPGQSVTFTATVSSMTGGTPTGIVTFLDGTTVLGTGTLTVVNGQNQATFTTTTLALGSHDITAIYDGDSTHADSASSVVQTVSLAGSNTYLTSSASLSQPGQAVTFTATVSSMSGGTPTGSVIFMDGNTVLGNGTLTMVNGQAQATFTTSALGLGSHNIHAVYSGDGTHAGSASALTQTINLAGTSTSLASSANPSPLDQPLTLTATVNAMGMGAGTPTGSVSFYDGTTLLGVGTLTEVNGQVQATFTTSALGLGTHAILAVYSGDDTFAESESSLEETITN